MNFNRGISDDTSLECVSYFYLESIADSKSVNLAQTFSVLLEKLCVHSTIDHDATKNGIRFMFGEH